MRHYIKKIIGLLTLGLLLSGCVTTVGVYEPYPVYYVAPAPVIIVKPYYFPHHFPARFYYR